MPQQKALECYIQELCEIDPGWEEKYAVTDDLVSLKFMICMYSLVNAWTENSCLLLVSLPMHINNVLTLSLPLVPIGTYRFYSV